MLSIILFGNIVSAKMKSAVVIGLPLIYRTIMSAQGHLSVFGFSVLGRILLHASLVMLCYCSLSERLPRNSLNNSTC